MTSAEIEKAIIETLQELQAGAGEPEQKITPATCPLAELGFFDSLLAIETTLVLEERLKCKCPDDSVFVEKETAKALTISQIAARLAQLAGKAA
jgi:acyl carrier protein